jgi:ribosomal protein S18 acetylase RimI-like enzyme
MPTDKNGYIRRHTQRRPHELEELAGRRRAGRDVLRDPGDREAASTDFSIDCSPAMGTERRELLDLMRAELASRLDQIMTLMGLTWPEFERLYESRGEVRTIRVEGAVAGYYWIERRGRELHLHAIIVLPKHRGRGIGGAALRGLEREFAGWVDVIERGVEQGNTGARSLYVREGFVVEEVRPDLGFEIMRKHVVDEPAN